MNIEKVIFSFFIVLALTLNFGFFLGGDFDNPEHHNVYELFVVVDREPDRHGAQVRRAHADGRGAAGHEPGRRVSS